MDKKLCSDLPSLLGKLNKINKIYNFSDIDSTNEEAKRIISSSGESDFLVISSKQSNGKGRNNNTFYSPDKSGIYFTLCLDAKKDISDTLMLTSIAAVATRNAIFTLTKKDTYIKWVNDIYQDNRKVCGILSELFDFSEKTYVILGIGINLYSDFPDELKDIAGNIGDIDKEKLISLIVNKITDFYSLLPEKPFLKDYTRYSNILGKEITYEINGEKKSGIAKGFNDNCNLIISDNKNQIILTGGEIHLRVKK